MESQPVTGDLFLLSHSAGSPLLFRFDKNLAKLAIIPVLSGLLRAPSSLALEKELIYLADPGLRRLLVLRVNGQEVECEDSVCEREAYGWHPRSVCLGLDGTTYFADADSAAVVADKA